MEHFMQVVADISVNTPFLFPSIVLALLVLLFVVIIQLGVLSPRDMKRQNKFLKQSQGDLYHNLEGAKHEIDELKYRQIELEGQILVRDDKIAIFENDAVTVFSKILRKAVEEGVWQKRMGILVTELMEELEDRTLPLNDEAEADDAQMHLFEEVGPPKPGIHSGAGTEG